MPDPRISHIELDEATILWRNADIEQERRIAIFDLIEENSFRPIGHDGVLGDRCFEDGDHGQGIVYAETQPATEDLAFEIVPITVLCGDLFEE